MRLIKQNLERDGAGSITLCPQEPEDMWHAFNLIRPEDRLRASAVRKVVTESKTGSKTSQRVHTTLTIAVQKIDFDAQAGQLHVGGPVVEDNKYVALGQHHTLDLELHRNFVLQKAEWDSVALQTVREACDAGEKAEIGAVVLQEGVANVCLVTEHMTVLRQRVECTVPRKRKGAIEAYQKGLEKFYSQTAEAALRHFDLTKLKVILLASPGFVAQGLLTHIFAAAARDNNRALLQSRPKWQITHCSSGHIHSLNEVLKSPAVATQLADTKFARETRALDTFYELLHSGDASKEDKAWYGQKEVLKAIEKGAVGTLLISNKVFRSANVGERRRWVRATEEVRAQGGEVAVLSSIHESGVRLDGLGGVAAILTYPLQGLDEEEEEGEEEEGEGEGEEGAGEAGEAGPAGPAGVAAEGA